MTELSQPTAAPFAEAERRALVPVVGWAAVVNADKPHALPVQPPLTRDGSVGYPWANSRPAERTSLLPYDPATAEAQRAVAFAWRLPQLLDATRSGRYTSTVRIEALNESIWRQPALLDTPTAAAIARLDVLDEIHRMAWQLTFEVRPNGWTIPWGQAIPPPTIVPNPTINQPPSPVPQPPPVYNPPPGHQVDLALICPPFSGPGDQVPLPFRAYECVRDQYVIENTIICRRVSTGEEFTCLEFSANGDIESFTDAFSAQLPRSALEIVLPLDQPVEVEIEVNGVTMLMLLEAWSEDVVFGDSGGRQDTIRVSGRSVSAELDEPFSAANSRFEENTRTWVQLMQQELPVDSAWQLIVHPSVQDYTVPGGTFSYQGLSPIRAIARIAEAVGAVVQQVPGGRSLLVLPRYPVPSWEMEATQADKQIDFGQIDAIGAEFRPSVRRNGIYVAGETAGGHLVRATRTGTAGAPWLDTVTDALITDPQAGLARARSEISATGRRQIYRATIPLVTGPTDPGMVLPGQLALVVESQQTQWTGLAVAWSLDGRTNESTGLVIWHSLSLERYRDE